MSKELTQAIFTDAFYVYDDDDETVNVNEGSYIYKHKPLCEVFTVLSIYYNIHIYNAWHDYWKTINQDIESFMDNYLEHNNDDNEFEIEAMLLRLLVVNQFFNSIGLEVE